MPRSTRSCNAGSRPSTSACALSLKSPAAPSRPHRKEPRDHREPPAARQRAAGLRLRHPSLEADAALLIDCGSCLHREDFTSRFITADTSISDGVTLLASTDWEAAVAALHAGELLASGGEQRMLLLAASIAGGIPVSLYDVLPSIDRRNASLVVGAVAHAAGHADLETDKKYLNG